MGSWDIGSGFVFVPKHFNSLGKKATCLWLWTLPLETGHHGNRIPVSKIRTESVEPSQHGSPPPQHHPHGHCHYHKSMHTQTHSDTHTHNCWAGWATSFYFPPHPSSVADQILLAPALPTLRALTFAHYSALLSLVAYRVQTQSEVWVWAGAQMPMSDQTEFSPGFCSYGLCDHQLCRVVSSTSHFYPVKWRERLFSLCGIVARNTLMPGTFTLNSSS